MALIPSSSSSSSASGCKYDVFLSFRGQDTRKTFTDHLYAGLKQKGIFTFRDDEKLQRGTFIGPELLKAIEESRFAVVILSKDYASSRWCLIELAKIVECMEKNGLVVLPVFHYVDPSDVRNLRDTFAEAFANHEQRLKDDIQDVHTWKSAFTKVTDLAGWDLNDKPESKVIQDILERISSELNRKFLSVSKDLVGIDSSVEKILDLCLDGLGGVGFVGICGMGGIGKTTLVQEIYNRISSCFEASSFIANVREENRNKGLVSLQKQLLSNILMEREINIWNFREGINVIGNRLRYKKVLIVLDDVDGEEQLEALAGNHDWFGPGSRIVVTSRDSHLLRRRGVNDIYTVKGLNNDDALQLFCWRAFNSPHPKENYVDLSKDFVNYAKGLPLALKVLGSLLFDKRTNEWKNALDQLKAQPDRNILDILQISFDGLMDTQKELFLDIACFFNGEKKDCIRDILKNSGSYPDYNIGVLMEKSLITIDQAGTLWMHDLLQEMGREIVRRESPKEPGRRSRLWLYEDVLHVLKNNTVTEVVEGIVLYPPHEKVEQLNAEAFSKLKKLRLLKVKNVRLPQGLNYLSNELCLMEWHGYPLKSLPAGFQPIKLVELILHCSQIKQLWKGIMSLGELKVIDLSDSQNLIETPEVSGFPNLKELILQHCTRLSKIHPSLGNLKRLTQLDLYGCKCLKSLPENLGNVESLEELYVGGTAITELPSSFVHLKNLRVLSLRGCEGLSSTSSNKLLNFPLMPRRRSRDPMGMLERSLSSLLSLTKLDLSYCNLRSIPDTFGCLPLLRDLDLSGNDFVCLPKSIIQLSNLIYLSVSGCTTLRCLPELPLNIRSIIANDCTSLETLPIIPEDDFRPNLWLVNCVKLIGNQGNNNILLNILRQSSMGYIDSGLLIPGSEIPKWFSHQSVGASMNLQVASDECNNNKWEGIFVCAVFVPRQHIHLSCMFKSNRNVFHGYTIRFAQEFAKIESYHLWMTYFHSSYFESKRSKQVLSQRDANGFNQIEIEITSDYPDLEVTKIGAHLVYKQDNEDLKQTMAGCSSCSITPYEDDFDDSAKDTKIKRSHDDYDADEAGPSGEGTSNDMDIPHPNVIERFIPRLGNWIGNLSTQEQGNSDCEEEESQSKWYLS